MSFKKHFYLKEDYRSLFKSAILAGIMAAPSLNGTEQQVRFNMPGAATTVSVDDVQKHGGTFNGRLYQYIKSNEGVRYKAYKDSKGHWTIGIGHLITPEERKDLLGKTLTEEQVYNLFIKDITSKEKLVKQTFGKSYDEFSESLKIAVIDGFFRGDLSGSPKTIKLLKSKMYKEAAAEYLNNQEYRQAKKSGAGVAKRMERNARFMMNEPSA